MSSLFGSLQFDDVASCDIQNAAGAVAVSPCGQRHASVIGRTRWTESDLQSLADTESPAAVLLAAYERHKDGFARVLAGNFSIVLVDMHEQAAYLAIDRFGIEQLFWAHAPGEGFYFSTSAKDLLEILPAAPELNYQSVYDFLYFHCVPSPSTMWEGVQKLEPGQMLRIGSTTHELGSYWEPDYGKPRRCNFQELKDGLFDSMKEAVAWSSSAGDCGAFLSGGLDSSAVCGVMQQMHDDPVKAFSVGFSDEEYNELEFAKTAANRFGLDHHMIVATAEQTIECLDSVFAAFEEPFGNSSIVPTFICARAAAQSGVNTLLAGDGGDELFAGNVRYAKQKLFEQYGRIPALIRRFLLEPLILRAMAGVEFSPVRKVRRYIEQAIQPLPGRMESYNHLENWSAEVVFSDDFLGRVDTDNPSVQLARRYHGARDADFLDRMLYLDWKFTLADNDLRKVTTMCKLAGVEARFPFLDERVVDLSVAVPSARKLRRLRLRHFFKESMSGFLPDSIIEKPKHGFGLPFGEWLKSSPELQETIYGLLRNLGERGVVQPDFINMLIEKHRGGHAAYYGNAVWVFMSLEMWFRQQPGGAISRGQ